MEIGRTGKQTIDQSVNIISYGGIEFKIDRNENFPIKQVIVNGRQYLTTYIQNRSIDTVSVQFDFNELGEPKGVIITSKSSVPVRKRKAQRMVVRALYDKFAGSGQIDDGDAIDISNIANFIFTGESQDTFITEIRPNKKLKTAAEIIPNLELNERDWREIAKVFPFRLHR